MRPYLKILVTAVFSSLKCYFRTWGSGDEPRISTNLSINSDIFISDLTNGPFLSYGACCKKYSYDIMLCLLLKNMRH